MVYEWYSKEQTDNLINQKVSGVTADASATDKGVVRLNGDLSGTANAPTVPGLAYKVNNADLATVAKSGNYNDLSNKPTIAGTNTGDQSLAISGNQLSISSGNSVTLPTSGTVSINDGSTTTKGIVRLAGDLAGTADSPSVPALASKANIDSPTFTGTPRVPLPNNADNSAQVATTSFVKAQGYAPNNSPALTGTPTAPTANVGTNTTQIATTAFVLANGVARGLVNVKDYGAKGDGTTDDTAAITAAWSASGGAIGFDRGNYLYNGAGLQVVNGIDFTIAGTGVNTTTITLGTNSRLIDVGTAGINSMQIANFTVKNGIGFFRSLRTSVQVSGVYSISNCQFIGYSGCCVEKNAQDWPNWVIRDCTFFGSNWNSTIGIASNGLTDGVLIENCQFERNRICIKLGYGGNNAYIKNCGFIHAEASARPATAFIWVVPQQTASNNIGAGMVVSDCRFGSENLLPNDYYTVYADEDGTGGGTFGSNWPNLVTVSGGRIGSHRYRDCLWLGSDGEQGALIFSTTPNVSSMRIDGSLAGTMPNYVLQYLSQPTYGADSGHVIGPFIGAGISSSITAGPQPTNDFGQQYLIDPNHNFDGRFGTHTSAPGASDIESYTRLLTKTAQVFTTSGSSKTNITNGYGDTGDAITANFNAGGYIQTMFDASTVAATPAFLDFSMKAGSQGTVRATIYNPDNSIAIRSTFTANVGWNRQRLPWTPRTASANYTIRFELPLGGSSGTISLGRINIYHGREPVNSNAAILLNGQRYKLGISGGNVTATSF